MKIPSAKNLVNLCLVTPEILWLICMGGDCGEDLLMWPSGQRTRPPYVVESDVLMAEVRASARARPPTKELFLIIPMHMMNRELIPGR